MKLEYLNNKAESQDKKSFKVFSSIISTIQYFGKLELGMYFTSKEKVSCSMVTTYLHEIFVYLLMLSLVSDNVCNDSVDNHHNLLSHYNTTIDTLTRQRNKEMKKRHFFIGKAVPKKT